jgi:hypothetical protein
MVTMIDEIFDRHYQAHRAELNASLVAAIAHLGRAAAQAFDALNRIEYQAPWAKAKPARRRLAQRRGARTSTHRAPRL